MSTEQDTDHPKDNDTASQADRILVMACVYNEGPKLKSTVERIVEAVPYDVLIADDGSTDGSIEMLKQYPTVHVVSNARNEGVGSAFKMAFEYTLAHKYDILVVMAGNNKDEPKEMDLLLTPILEGKYDFVQGSRYLSGGGHQNMPMYRKFATRLHPFLFSLAVRKQLTESTNGYRAFRTSILNDPAIDWHQDWLDAYELEPYLLYKVITLGYRHTEVPVTKIYPPKSLGYTKMKAVTGWWSILRPIFYMALGIKK